MQTQDIDNQPALKTQPLDLELLAKLLAMIGIDSDAAALGYARKANELVRQTGHPWIACLKAPDSPPPPRAPETHKRPDEMSVNEMIEHCARHAHSLSPDQRRFIFNIRNRRWPLTPRQLKYLFDLAHQVEAFR